MEAEERKREEKKRATVNQRRCPPKARRLYLHSCLAGIILREIWNTGQVRKGRRDPRHLHEKRNCLRATSHQVDQVIAFQHMPEGIAREAVGSRAFGVVNPTARQFFFNEWTQGCEQGSPEGPFSPELNESLSHHRTRKPRMDKKGSL